MRCTFECISACGKIDADTGILRVMGKEIAFVYYRTGYQADHYLDEARSEKKWEVREMLECSMAIKCPSVDFQLTTFKKYQQAFSDENLLQKVTGRSVEKVKHLFKGLYSLELFETDKDV